MDLAWGIVILALGLLAWVGQALAWLVPTTAARFGLVEAETAVEPLYWADIRGEALWDIVTLWPLPLAGTLLIVGEPAWALSGLAGGAIYVYFAGRGIATRLQFMRGGFRVGSPSSVRVGLLMLGVWGAAGAVTATAAAVTLA